MKVVINTCYGGFSISRECAELMAQKGCPIAKAELEKINQADDTYWYGYGYAGDFSGYDRTSTFLIEAVEELGERANNTCSELKIVEILDGIEYEICEYDGIEHIAERHRTWA